MANLAAANVTTTWSDSSAVPKSGDIVIEGRTRKSWPTIAFGNGALLYPSGGIPLPAIGNFGMIRDIKGIKVLTGQKAGVIWDYDKTNHKLKCYEHTHSLRVARTSADAAADRMMASAVDLWVSEPAAGGSDFQVDGLASGVTSHGGVEAITPGALTELAATVAPVATTLALEVTGW